MEQQRPSNPHKFRKLEFLDHFYSLQSNKNSQAASWNIQVTFPYD